MTRYWDAHGRFGYLGIALFPYQLAFGLSLRWFERGPHIRVYLGPIKLYGGAF